MSTTFREDLVERHGDGRFAPQARESVTADQEAAVLAAVDAEMAAYGLPERPSRDDALEEIAELEQLADTASPQERAVIADRLAELRSLIH